MRALAVGSAVLATLAAAACSRTELYDDLGAGGDASVEASVHEGGTLRDGRVDAPSLDAGAGAPEAEAVPTVPPSCADGGPGISGCGPGAESCCTTVALPGGTFFRSYGYSDAGPTQEADPATVSALRMDAYEATVGRFRTFAAAWSAGWRPAKGSGKHVHLNGGKGLANVAGAGLYEPGWDPADDANVTPTDDALGSCGAFSTWTPSPGSNEELPIDCVTWAESYAFCIWDGGFLPSEAEWEYAAAGGAEQREYPWGETDPGMQNEYAIYGCYYANPVPPAGQCNVTIVPGIAPVGTTVLGASLFGQHDLAGNVWEETLDGFATYVTPCVDGAQLGAGLAKVVRGGCFISETYDLLPPARFELPIAIRNNYVGFRCARVP